MKPKVSLYLFDLATVSQQEIYALKALLNSEQKDKCDSINPRKQSEFIVSRSLLSFAIKMYLANDHTAIDIQERSQLPPLVKQAEENNIQFSISHSQSLIGIAIGQNLGAVGFDLQAIKKFSNNQDYVKKATDSARYFCNESQLSTLLSYVDQNNENSCKSAENTPSTFSASVCVSGDVAHKTISVCE